MIDYSILLETGIHELIKIPWSWERVSRAILNTLQLETGFYRHFFAVASWNKHIWEIGVYLSSSKIVSKRQYLFWVVLLDAENDLKDIHQFR